MNIFFLDENPKIAFSLLEGHEKLQRKMITESFQMLSTVIRTKLDIQHEELMKCFNPKHPSNKWLMASWKNFEWLLEYTEFGFHSMYKNSVKENSSSLVRYPALLKICRELIPFHNDCLTPPYLAMDNSIQIKYSTLEDKVYVAKSFKDAIEAYSEYMKTKPYVQHLLHFNDL